MIGGRATGAPYRHDPGYRWHWVHIDRSDCHQGWDGVHRLILRDGTADR